jgi:hypothetical protein
VLILLLTTVVFIVGVVLYMELSFCNLSVAVDRSGYYFFKLAPVGNVSNTQAKLYINFSPLLVTHLITKLSSKPPLRLMTNGRSFHQQK